MTDIVERLRSPANVFYEYAADNGAFLREAAAEIERLRDELDRYNAKYIAASRFMKEDTEVLPLWQEEDKIYKRIKEFRAASGEKE